MNGWANEPPIGIDRVQWDSGATVAIRGGPCLDACDQSYWAYVLVDGVPRPEPGEQLPWGEGDWQCWMELDFVGDWEPA